jgi:cellulose 1,4-beta-cellobiosidase
VTYLASQIYRNYDGNKSTFGETSVSASVGNPDNLSAFAAQRTADGALTVMVINKQQGSTPVTVNLSGYSASGTAQAWQVNSASQTAIARLADVSVSNNAISTTVPSQSITLFVIPSGSVLSSPSAPTGLAATVGSGTVTLTWNAAAGATGYAVKRGSVSGGPYTTIATPAATSYTDGGLTNGSAYYYVVSASNSAGNSPNSSEVSATPIGAQPPAAPTGLMATKGNKQVVLNWNAVSGATSYNVYRGTSPGAEGSTPIATGVTSTSYTNTRLTNGKTYYYQVAAVNSAGTGPRSNEASATPSAK